MEYAWQWRSEAEQGAFNITTDPNEGSLGTVHLYAHLRSISDIEYIRRLQIMYPAIRTYIIKDWHACTISLIIIYM